MNQKTARVLNKYASKTGKNSRGLKKDWEALPSTERAAERKKMKDALDK
jgi:hypothetical protein